MKIVCLRDFEPLGMAENGFGRKRLQEKIVSA